MTALTVTLGTVIAKCLVRAWLGDKTLGGSVGQSLLDLLAQKLSDRRKAKPIAERFQEIGDKAASNLADVLAHEHHLLAEHERQAALYELELALTAASIDSALLARQNLSAKALEKHIRKSRPTAKNTLSQAGSDAYEFLVCEISKRIISIAAELPEFDVRTTGKVLSKLSVILQSHNELVKKVDVIHSNVTRIAQSVSHPHIGIDAEIDQAKKLMFNGKIDVALDRLDQLKARYWGTMSIQQRFRVFHNRGAAKQLQGELAEAATAFLDAIVLDPTCEKARCLEVQVCSIQGDEKRATQLAARVWHDYPRSEEAARLWVAHADDSVALEDIEASIPADMREMLVVANALSIRARDVGKFDIAEKYARHVLAISGECEDQAIHDLSMILLQRETNGNLDVRAALPVQDKAGRLREVIDLVGRALNKLGPTAPPKRVAVLRNNRAMALRLLGRDRDAMVDLRVAYELFPSSEEITLSYCHILRADERLSEAIEILRERMSSKATYRVAFLYALLLSTRNQNGDRTEAERVLRSQISSGTLESSQAYASALEMHIKLLDCSNHLDLACEIVDQVKDQITAIQFHTFKGVIFGRSKNNSMALEHAELAFAENWQSADWFDQRRLADLLTRLERYHEALLIWKRVAPPDCVAEDLYTLLHCAQKAEDFELILETCEELRKRGYIDERCFTLELNTLFRFNCVDQAIEAMQESLRNPPNDEFVPQTRLWLSLAGLRLGKPDLIESNPERLPSVSKVDAPMGAAVVDVLRHSNPFQGADYAYNLNRRFPHDQQSHMAVIVSLLMTPQVELPIHSKVGAGVAVFLEDETTQQQYWRIIEDSNQPIQDISRNELSQDHPHAKALLGASCGDRVLIEPDEIYPRYVKVIEILDKRAYRCGQCLDEFEERFPHNNSFKRFSVKNPSTGDFDFSTVVAVMAKRAAYITDLDQRFRNEPHCPISLFAKMAGASVMDAMAHISQVKNMEIRCCSGSAEERHSALAAIQLAPAIVIDSTAIATLLLLGKVDILDSITSKLIISRGTQIELKAEFDRLFNGSGTDLTVAASNGQLTAIQWSPEDKGVMKERFEKLFEITNKRVSILETFGLARLDSKSRNTLTSVFGQAGAEAIYLASQAGRVLWTDDAAVAGFAHAQFQVKRTWTQLLVQWLVNLNRIQVSELHEISLALMQRRYTFTSINAEMVARAIMKSDWDIDKSPLREVLDHWSDERVNIRTLNAILVEILCYIRRFGTDKTKSDSVIIAILNRVAHRPGGESLLNFLQKNLSDIYGLDVIAVINMERIITSIWGSSQKKIVLASPFDLLRMPPPPGC